jgi:phosphoadenosine phosphosulfate reductase
MEVIKKGSFDTNDLNMKTFSNKELSGRRKPNPQKSMRGMTFAPGKIEIFWCEACNLPLLSGVCSTCNGSGTRIELSPPGDVRMASEGGAKLLSSLFGRYFGCHDAVKDRIILFNKIAGIDRRDQVILDGHHIATIWFDIISHDYRLDLEVAGAVLLSAAAERNLIVVNEAFLKGHIKGKWIPQGMILDRKGMADLDDPVILQIGKFYGVGVVRKRADGSSSIRVKDVTSHTIKLNEKKPGIKQLIEANRDHLDALEREAEKEISRTLSRSRLPVNVSFSGGKDSLAVLSLLKKMKGRPEVLFINTGLEFPQTVDYVRDLCKKHHLRLSELNASADFYDEAALFGPPAKDYRWCCKTHKLGPLAAFIEKNYPKGCITIEGRRIYESFNRSRIGEVERNPYVPNQTTLNPIRNWRAIEVMLYILRNGLQPNPLYEQDYERIGCWMCPAALQSEFEQTRRSNPDLCKRWTAILDEWAGKNGMDPRYVEYGLWRWKSLPPKMEEIAGLHHIDLKGKQAMPEETSIAIARGRSPCGLKHSIEASLRVPQRHGFDLVAACLSTVGPVKYKESLGVCLIKTQDGRCTVFSGGNMMIIASEEKADGLLEKAVEAIIRVQNCTRCGICMKRCEAGAIKIDETINVDPEICTSCGRCVEGCIAASEAARIIRSASAKSTSA